jgi:hypothetical protein
LGVRRSKIAMEVVDRLTNQANRRYRSRTLKLEIGRKRYRLTLELTDPALSRIVEGVWHF